MINDTYAPSTGTTTFGATFSAPYLYATGYSALYVMKASGLVSQGACSSSGAYEYISGNNVMAYCNGGLKVPMGTSPGAGGAGCSAPTAVRGGMNFSGGKMNYCDGTNWVPIN